MFRFSSISFVYFSLVNPSTCLFIFNHLSLSYSSSSSFQLHIFSLPQFPYSSTSNIFSFLLFLILPHTLFLFEIYLSLPHLPTFPPYSLLFHSFLILSHPAAINSNLTQIFSFLPFLLTFEGRTKTYICLCRTP